MPPYILANSLLIFFAIILLGTYLGKISVKNISLGSGAIFLVALVFGHFGFTMPKEVSDLGLVLFVYAISIQVGPHFFKVFRKDGWKFAMTAFVAIMAGIIATVSLAFFFHIPDNLAIGMFSGAMTSTQSLAVAVDMAEKNNPGDGSVVTAGYGIAYPFSVVATVLFVQFLPWMLRRKPEEEEEEWEKMQKSAHRELSVRQFRVENKAIFGKTIEAIHLHQIAEVNLSRVRRGGKEKTAVADFVLEENDIITAVGEMKELDKLAMFIGTETKAPLARNKIISEDVEVISQEFANKKIGDLHVFYENNLVVVRVIRQDFEIAPNGGTLLEVGDIIRIVGDHAEVNKMIKRIGVKNEKLNETNMLPFLLGLVFGVLIGAIPIHLFGGTTLTLGSSGGALLAGLYISHRKRIGKMEMHVPIAALNLIRDFGLMLFLAGVGLVAGGKFAHVFQQYGFSILLAGALVTLSALVFSTIFLLVAKDNILAVMSGVSGAMTQAAGLNVTKTRSKTELPTLVYASVYPFAMLGKVVFIQFLVYILWRF
ncbi:MAG: TrkA C-terminal domain-containing protein [Candidatus Paceibacterota bacterium]|jgi:putative transport protein